MRWTLARGLLRGNLVSSQKEQVAAISTTAISEQAHQTPSRPLSSAPLPQKTTDVTDNRIDLKTSVPGMYYNRDTFYFFHFSILFYGSP